MSDGIPAVDDMSYEAAERHLLRQGMEMTFTQKLEWLEETAEFARRFSVQDPCPNLPSGPEKPGRESAPR